jgi:hypothetical protein
MEWGCSHIPVSYSIFSFFFRFGKGAYVSTRPIFLFFVTVQEFRRIVSRIPVPKSSRRTRYIFPYLQPWLPSSVPYFEILKLMTLFPRWWFFAFYKSRKSRDHRNNRKDGGSFNFDGSNLSVIVVLSNSGQISPVHSKVWYFHVSRYALDAESGVDRVTRPKKQKNCHVSRTSKQYAGVHVDFRRNRLTLWISEGHQVRRSRISFVDLKRRKSATVTITTGWNTCAGLYKTRKFRPNICRWIPEWIRV